MSLKLNQTLRAGEKKPLPYPSEPSEFEVAMMIANACLAAGLDARCEVGDGKGFSTKSRLDIVIFNPDKTVRRIIEVKKYRSTALGFTRRNSSKPTKAIDHNATRRQCQKYFEYGPVDLVCGAKAAKAYCVAQEFLSECDTQRSFG